jgi:hypothetical protein
MAAKRTITCLAALAGALLVGCTKPIPADKSDYVGHWIAPGMTLLITQGGQVEYKRVVNNVSTTINAPLKAFEGANLIVGVGPLSTTFVVSAIPHQEEGVWTMTVDGVVLTRDAANSTPWESGQSVRF